jgi:hypothetical protein
VFSCTRSRSILITCCRYQQGWLGVEEELGVGFVVMVVVVRARVREGNVRN